MNKKNKTARILAALSYLIEKQSMTAEQTKNIIKITIKEL